MRTLSLPLRDCDIDTRGKRRKVCRFIAREIMRVYKAEGSYMERMPENIAQGHRHLYASVAAEELFEASIMLAEAFEPF